MEHIDEMLLSLEPEIENKCNQIKEQKREKLASKLFVLLAMAILIIPTVLVFIGISFITILMPLIIIGAGFVVLSPLLFNQGGLLYE